MTGCAQWQITLPQELQEKKKFFTPEQLAKLDPRSIPRHVAIIPDGNRRWARQRAQHIDNGHRQGCDNLIAIVRAAKELGIKVITFYLFSTENWSRDKEEVNALMWLLENFLIEQRQEMIDGGMRLETIGDLIALPESIIATIAETKQATAHCDQIVMVAALNYGARDELRRACQKMLDDCVKQQRSCEAITEELLASYLDTAEWGDPDLLIRTSGEMRISNFLLWQISYAEICVLDVLWPDFCAKHLWEAICYFQARERRLGGGT